MLLHSGVLFFLCLSFEKQAAILALMYNCRWQLERVVSCPNLDCRRNRTCHVILTRPGYTVRHKTYNPTTSCALPTVTAPSAATTFFFARPDGWTSSSQPTQTVTGHGAQTQPEHNNTSNTLTNVPNTTIRTPLAQATEQPYCGDGRVVDKNHHWFHEKQTKLSMFNFFFTSEGRHLVDAGTSGSVCMT